MATLHRTTDLPVGYRGGVGLKQLTWPTAFAIVFGGVPALVFLVAVLGVYPFVGWPFLAGFTTAYGMHRRACRRDALALRAEADYLANLAVVSAPIPELPTVPMRAVGNPVGSMRRAS